MCQFPTRPLFKMMIIDKDEMEQHPCVFLFISPSINTCTHLPRYQSIHPFGISSVNSSILPTPIYSIICPSIHPSVHPFISSYTHPFIHLSIHPSIHSSVLSYTHPSIYPSVYLAIHPSIHQSKFCHHQLFEFISLLFVIAASRPIVCDCQQPDSRLRQLERPLRGGG